MIPTLSMKRKALPLVVLLLFSASLACNMLTGGGNNEVSEDKYPQEEVPEGEYPSEITIERDITYGPGSFDLPDPKAGLSDLSSYKASLTVTFDGTRDGKAENWSKTYVMLAIREPAARQLTIEKRSDSANLDPVFMAESDGAAYKKVGQAACDIAPIQQDNSLAELFEPALFLDGVIGTDEAGNDTVNDVAVNHYTFDQRALGEDGVTESTGEMWVASEGGYLVKYVLMRNAGADYFGEGVEGTLTLDYELIDLNQTDTVIALPDDCPPGFVDAPLLPDASNLSNIPGALAFDTSSSIAEAAAFYEENIPGLGWEAQDEPSITDTAAILTYQKGEEMMFIFIKSVDAKTQVRITVSKTSPPP